MDRNKKLELIAEILDTDPDELNDDMELDEAGEWDSLAILSFIAMMGEEFGKEVTGDQAKKMVTVADALKIME